MSPEKSRAPEPPNGAAAPATPAPVPVSAPQGAESELLAEEIFDRAATKLAEARVPIATYRVQFNRAFTFEDATARVQYLSDLGVSDLYASPFFRARPDSTHGYDLVDHNALHSFIGLREQFNRMTDALAERQMGLLLDFVPNHMGIGNENAWWMDVLENGPSSLFAPFFDIDWAPLKVELYNKVLLPILGDHYGRVLENGELRLEYEQGAFFLHYYEKIFPINPRTYPIILEPLLPKLIKALGEEHDTVLEFQSILTGLGHLPPRTETHRSKVMERRREKEILKRRLASVIDGAWGLAAALQERLATLNGQKGSPRSFDALDAILEEQAYRLSFWRVAAEEINYRRFFDVNDLAAIRMENPAVFAQAHKLVLELIGERRVTGLRIDHPDGLWEPISYFKSVQRAVLLERLRRYVAESPQDSRARSVPWDRLEPMMRRLVERASRNEPGSPITRPLYMVVEKILARGESLPDDWPVHGTSGYEFATYVSGLFVDAASERAMTDLYHRFIGREVDFESLVYEKKKLILRTAMASELNVLAHGLNRISERDRHSRDFTLGALKDALREVIASFPVYRTYVNERGDPMSEHDRMAIMRAIRLARRRNPTTDASIFEFVRAILMQEVPSSVREEDRSLWCEFVMKFQQLTGPVMAKGLEDTAFYNYNRLVSLNEVGGEPERYGQSAQLFHRVNADRQRLWPCSMLTTSTHDTKRGEDVRARISVLSELPQAWEGAIRRLSGAAEKFKTDLDGQLAPDRNEEYLLYQTLIGSYPAKAALLAEGGGGAGAGAAPEKDYIDRIVAYMRKATKEAKVNTSWINANPEYDAALETFVRGLLSPEGPFALHLAPLALLCAYHGMWGALSQALLKLTAPGVPDIYQGNEMWDDSLVDPDNRRPVDYNVRAAALAEVRARRGEGRDLARELTQTAADGRIKLFVTMVALEARRNLREAFGSQAAYIPQTAAGPHAEHVVAFTRRAGEEEVVVVAPRLTAKLCGGRREPPLGAIWSETRIMIAEGRFMNLFTGETVSAEERDGGSALLLDQVLADFPVALLSRTMRAESRRG
ncbi:MAG: malto-oligosyltrehalose synthase [Polyangiaceae bacterium]|nr:malto-oligosyltrehalose synthase [Polyangiaceae bacterium]